MIIKFRMKPKVKKKEENRTMTLTLIKNVILRMAKSEDQEVFLFENGEIYFIFLTCKPKSL